MPIDHLLPQVLFTMWPAWFSTCRWRRRQRARLRSFLPTRATRCHHSPPVPRTRLASGPSGDVTTRATHHPSLPVSRTGPASGPSGDVTTINHHHSLRASRTGVESGSFGNVTTINHHHSLQASRTGAESGSFADVTTRGTHHHSLLGSRTGAESGSFADVTTRGTHHHSPRASRTGPASGSSGDVSNQCAPTVTSQPQPVSHCPDVRRWGPLHKQVARCRPIQTNINIDSNVRINGTVVQAVVHLISEL